MSPAAELVRWNEEQRCNKAVAALKMNGFDATYLRTAQEAHDYIVAEAADAVTVGLGGSLTIAGLGVQATLQQQGKEILTHWLPGLTREEVIEIKRRQLVSDLFLTSSNAVTLNGWLVNIDGSGNRVAAMSFGPRKVIVVAGRNKLVDGELREAIERVKNRASVPNAKRLDSNTPCAKTGFCSNCNSPDRICRITTVIDRKPSLTDVRVLVVNEDLGL